MKRKSVIPMNVPQEIFKSAEGHQAILDFYDQILQKWPVPYTTSFLSTRHGETFVIACGDESFPALILLHGSSSNSASWMGDVVQLSSRYRVFAVDMPGEPGKSEPIRRTLDGPAYTEWMEDIFSALNLNTSGLVGISLGAWLALKYAVSHPDKVSTLVLLCPSGIAPQKRSFLPRVVLLMLLGSWGRKRVMQIINGNAVLPQEVLDFLTLVGSNFNPRVAVMPLFSDEELRRLNMPVLMIGGAEDALLPSSKTAARLKRLAPHATTEVLPNTGHVLTGLTDKIVAFLN
ncbi:MAG: alpha/beta fold hydrolase [Ignavibacteriales bacterium]